VPLLYVDGDGVCGSGGEDDPLCSIQDAIDVGAAAVIHVAQTATAYAENLEITGGKRIVILAREGDRPVVDPPGSGPTLEIAGIATRAYVEGLRFQDNNDTHALAVSGASTAFDRVESVRNGGGALRVSDFGRAVVRNCILGADANNVEMVRVDDGAALDMLYTTVVAGVETAGPTHALACDGDAEVTVRNSFLAATGLAPEFACRVAIVSHTAAETVLPGTGNVTLGSYAPSWYANFGTGNYRLGEPPAAVLITARWLSGDPPVDIDGDPRPTKDGETDAAGADR
jgi:hypothetical protein